MVATRRRGRSEAELPEDDGGEIEVPEKQAVDNDSSEDDAPEEITLDRGKQDAVKLRKQEIYAKKKARQDVKDRRKRLGRGAKATIAELAPDDTAGAEEEGEFNNEDMDTLPEDVIAAINDFEAQDRRFMERRIVSEQLRVRQKHEQSRKITERQIGAITVQTLSAGSQRKPSESARTFLLERLHGGVKRSIEMLKPVKIDGMTRERGPL